MTTFKEQFYAEYAPLAIKEQARSGIPASVTLAQAYLEGTSNNNSTGTRGLSGLASKFKNFFGIKTSSQWTGEVTNQVSNEEVNGVLVPKVSAFRVYSSAAESFADHTDFLMNNPTYMKNGVFSSHDPLKVATALQSAGYATSSSYASDLMREITDYGLTKYDGGDSIDINTHGDLTDPNNPYVQAQDAEEAAAAAATEAKKIKLLEPDTWIPALKSWGISALSGVVVLLIILFIGFIIWKTLEKGVTAA
jgi:flagellum-specific peptidoglycan hydrolase FlgJ